MSRVRGKRGREQTASGGAGGGVNPLEQQQCPSNYFGIWCSSKAELVRHECKEHRDYSKIAFNCLECGKRYQKETDGRNCWYTHLPNKPYKCSGCNTGFTRKDNGRKHFKRCLKKGEVENLEVLRVPNVPDIPFQCLSSDCKVPKKVFESCKALKKHQKECYGKFLHANKGNRKRRRSNYALMQPNSKKSTSNKTMAAESGIAISEILAMPEEQAEEGEAQANHSLATAASAASEQITRRAPMAKAINDEVSTAEWDDILGDDLFPLWLQMFSDGDDNMQPAVAEEDEPIKGTSPLVDVVASDVFLSSAVGFNGRFTVSTVAATLSLESCLPGGCRNITGSSCPLCSNGMSSSCEMQSFASSCDDVIYEETEFLRRTENQKHSLQEFPDQNPCGLELDLLNNECFNGCLIG